MEVVGNCLRQQRNYLFLSNLASAVPAGGPGHTFPNKWLLPKFWEIGNIQMLTFQQREISWKQRIEASQYGWNLTPQFQSFGFLPNGTNTFPSVHPALIKKLLYCIHRLWMVRNKYTQEFGLSVAMFGSVQSWICVLMKCPSVVWVSGSGVRRDGRIWSLVSRLIHV